MLALLHFHYYLIYFLIKQFLKGEIVIQRPKKNFNFFHLIKFFFRISRYLTIYPLPSQSERKISSFLIANWEKSRYVGTSNVGRLMFCFDASDKFPHSFTCFPVKWLILHLSKSLIFSVRNSNKDIQDRRILMAKKEKNEPSIQNQRTPRESKREVNIKTEERQWKAKENELNRQDRRMPMESERKDRVLSSIHKI